MSSAQGWQKWFPWMQRSMHPVVEWFGRAARLAPGQRVLDVACGTGLPSLHCARLVAPGGSVVATDSSAEMLAATRTNAAAAGLDNLEVREMDANVLGFPDASFDALTSSFWLMFSADPVKAASEMRRVLRPGGRAAIAVWAERERNPYFTALFGTLMQFAPPAGPPPDPKAPGQFRLGPPGELEAVLRAAGFAEIAVEEVDLPQEVESVEQYWQMFADIVPALAAPVLAAPAAEQARFLEALRAACAPFATERGLRLPSVARCASARA